MNQEIIFVTGKGGVGKSAVAAALAYAKAKSGKKTLLVELGYQSFYQDYFNLERVSYHPQSLKPNLDLALWSGPESLKEYVLHLVKVEALYRLFFENPVSKALINIAPALSEVAILGKITSGFRNVGPRLDYECLVIDAYATGHFLALLKAPKGVSEAIRFGPMGAQTREIFEVLMDPQKSKYFVVSFPEELPILEALELDEGIQSIVKIQPSHILNRYLPTPANINPGKIEGSSANNSFASYIGKVADRQAWSISKFTEQHLKPQILPFVPKASAWDVVETLSQEFSSC